MTTPARHQEHEVVFTQELMRELLLRTAESPGADFRVLAYYATAVPLGHTVRETAKAVAKAVHLNEGSVSKSIQRLREGGWLEVAYRMGPVNFYRVGLRVIELARPGDNEGDDLATVHHLTLGWPTTRNDR